MKKSPRKKTTTLHAADPGQRVYEFDAPFVALGPKNGDVPPNITEPVFLVLNLTTHKIERRPGNTIFHLTEE